MDVEVSQYLLPCKQDWSRADHRGGKKTQKKHEYEETHFREKLNLYISSETESWKKMNTLKKATDLAHSAKIT